jgi:hypothetical protein
LFSSPKKIEFDPKNYEDESKLPVVSLFTSMLAEQQGPMTLARRQQMAYVREEDARTKREVHEVPGHVFLDVERGVLSPATLEWAKEISNRPDVIRVVIERESLEHSGYLTLIPEKDGVKFLTSLRSLNTRR